MIMKKLKLALILGAFAVSQAATADALENLNPYPEAQEGMVRQVIILPELEHEDDAKVELQIGKNIQVDCNSYFFGGTLKEETVQGWGYDYWILNELKGPMSTLMACTEGSQKEAFVTLSGEPTLLRYNSKLPIVVYVPEGVEVKYRIWQAGPELDVAETL